MRGKNKVKMPDEIFMGTEPVVIGKITDRNDIRLAVALNWYNYMYGVERGKPWLLEYMKKEGYPKKTIEGVGKAPDWKTSTTVCWIARILLNGNKLPQSCIDWMNEQIRHNVAAGIDLQEKEIDKVVVDIQARMRDIADYHISEIEGMIDEVIVNPKATVDVYSYLTKKQISRQVVSIIKEYFVLRLEELQTDDEQIQEAYGDRLQGWIKFYITFLEDVGRYIGNKKKAVVRKPRKAKERLAIDFIKNLKYQQSFAGLKLVSINSTDVVGAESLWIFNTKYNKLTVYYARTREGLSVRGTTLTGFDAELSQMKTLRKPEEGLKTVLSGGKIVLKKFMDTLTTKPTQPNGRINDQTILLRAIK